MKTWKKLSCIALSVTLTWSFAACGDKGKTPTPEEAARNYSSVATQTLEDVKAFRLEISIDTTETEKRYGAGGVVDESLTQTETSSVDVVFTLAIEENGFSVHQLITEVEQSPSGIERSYEEVIIVGGFEYSREYGEGVSPDAVLWEKEPAQSTDVIALIADAADVPEAALRKMLASKEVKDAMNGLREDFTEALEEKLEDGEMSDGVASWGVDFAPDLSVALTYLQAVDETIVTLEKLFNDVMAMSGYPITYAALTAELKALSQKPVSEALDMLSQVAQSKYGVTLQQLLTKVLSGELAEVVMTDVLKMDQATVSAMKALTVEDIKAFYSGMTVGAAINQLLLQTGAVTPPAEGEAPVDYCADALAAMEAAGKQTLQQLEVSFDGLNGFSVTKLALSAGVDFSGDGKTLEAIFGGFAMAISGPNMEKVNGVSVQTGVDYVTMDLTVTASQFSSVKTVIDPPAANMLQPAA